MSILNCQMVTPVLKKVGKYSGNGVNRLFGDMASFLRRCLFRVLSMGPIPTHFAFIMDGNRRYAKKLNLEEGDGHKAGYLALMSVLLYCYELGIKYVTVYAFSIENFKRRPDEVQSLMDLMLEKIEALLMEESIVNQYGIRVYFIGNLKLLSEPVRAAAEKVMSVTANNNKAVLLVCVAYTSSDEIVHAVEESCKDKRSEIRLWNSSETNNGEIEDVKEVKKTNCMIVHDIQNLCDDRSAESQGLKSSRGCNGVIGGFQRENGFDSRWDEVLTSKASRTGEFSGMEVEGCENLREKHPVIKLVDVEKHMYMAVAPDPDILIRSSGETRLSNFLLWQTSYCPLYYPAALWPEIGLWQLTWAILNFQRTHSYLEKKKQLKHL
ncbi:rubber cis-polyprenyltransferase HRT2-like isoform X2 [Durio zibethinus]|uniref:Alkyl transferase n=1 Tax=Durio zibethinus TaxID=66656 RepID=A0A6P5YG64_DURZI|nr:rubber cis-polyprenyltransferase HRT2-like isoform X2 [Durio zibethinus]XP_022739355.1 rubber cis-polyprenyltransferase HRT2-like isoform X2 [Durio zibethinus]